MQPTLLIFQYKIRNLQTILRPVVTPFVELLAHDHALEAGHVTLLSGNLEVAVDDGDSKQDTGSATKSTEKVAAYGKSTNASTTEGGSSRDNTLELLVHGLLTVTGHDETLLLKLLGNIAGRRARDLDPGLCEYCACNEHVDDEDRGHDRVRERLGNAEGRRPELVSNEFCRTLNVNLHVVRDTRGSEKLSRAFLGLPDTKELDKKVIREAAVQHLADQEDVGGQSRLQHNRHVGGVEQADGV